MNENMEVRHGMSGRVRKPQGNGRSAYYSFAKDGKSYSRSFAMLFRATFPEKDDSGLPKAGRPRKPRRPKVAPVTNIEAERLRMNRFYRIESFPNYGINRKGEVLNLESHDIVVPSARDGLSVHLRKDGVWHYIAVRTLLRRTFGD